MEITVKTYPAPSVNYREIMRYSGIGKDAAELMDLIENCIAEAESSFSYKVAYRVLPISVTEKTVDFGSFKAESADLAKCLQGCEKAVVFAATVGMGIDRIIKKYSVLSPAKSVIFQAIGAERCESLCDIFNNEIAQEAEVTPRFSAGYGDFALEHQKDIFALLDMGRKIGVTLGENLLMSPSKSVTAVIGIKGGKQDEH